MASGSIFCAEFQQVLPDIPDESVQLVFTSPPYGVGKAYESDFRFGVLLEEINLVFRHVARVLKRGGYAVFNFGNLIPGRDVLGTREPCEMPMGWLYWAFGLGNGLVLQAQRVWQKDFAKITSGKHAISAPRAVPEFEHLYTFRRTRGEKKQIMRNRKVSQRAIWSTSGEPPMNKAHPAAFPESLARRVVEVYSDPGDVVLDPFAGSGTVGAVCEKMDRKYILIEKEAGYIDEMSSILSDYGASLEELFGTTT